MHRLQPRLRSRTKKLLCSSKLTLLNLNQPSLLSRTKNGSLLLKNSKTGGPQSRSNVRLKIKLKLQSLRRKLLKIDPKRSHPLSKTLSRVNTFMRLMIV